MSAGRKRCSKGKSCGETCINRGLLCRVDLGIVFINPLNKLSDNMMGLSGSATSAKPAQLHQGDEAQKLAREIFKKRRKKEDYSQEWKELLKMIKPMDGEEKRDATIKAKAAIGERLTINVDHKAESKAEAQQAGKKLLGEFKEIGRTVDMINRYDALFKSVAGRLKSSWSPERIELAAKKMSEFLEKKYKAQKELEEIMTRVRERMLQTSLTEKQVRDLVSRVWTHEASEATRSHMTEFVRMFNGRGFTDVDENGDVKSLRYVADSPGRAHAKVDKGVVYTSGDKPTTFHEIAHIMEAQRPWLHRYTVQWRDGRAFDNIADIRESTAMNVPASGFYKAAPGKSVPLVRLGDLRPYQGYKESEVAVVDKFFGEYMGKVYGASTPWVTQKVTEVWSVAVQQFASPQAMAAFYVAHPDLFEVVAGLTVS